MYDLSFFVKVKSCMTKCCALTSLLCCCSQFRERGWERCTILTRNEVTVCPSPMNFLAMIIHCEANLTKQFALASILEEEVQVLEKGAGVEVHQVRHDTDELLLDLNDLGISGVKSAEENDALLFDVPLPSVTRASDLTLANGVPFAGGTQVNNSDKT